MVKRERKIDVIDLPVVKRTIRQYDNFETVRKQHRRTRSRNSAKLYMKILVYSVIFMGVSAFKMTTLYDVMDLTMKLQKLNTDIYETELVIDDLNYSFDSKENLKEVENLSKKLGFVDDRDIRYVRFN